MPPPLSVYLFLLRELGLRFLFCLATVIAVTRLAIAVTVSGILSIAFSSNLSQSSLFNFLTSFPYLDYIISRYTEKVKHFDEVFLNFFKKNRPCPEVGELEGTPSKSVDLIRFYFTFFIIISLRKSPNQVAFLFVAWIFAIIGT